MRVKPGLNNQKKYSIKPKFSDECISLCAQSFWSPQILPTVFVLRDIQDGKIIWICELVSGRFISSIPAPRNNWSITILSFPPSLTISSLLIHNVNIIHMQGVSFDSFWSWGKAWTPELEPSHWLSHHKAEHKNQMFHIFQGTPIFKLILPQERIRAGSWGGVDVTLTHHFQMLVLDGPNLMNPVPKGQVEDSDFSQKVKNISSETLLGRLSSQFKFAPLTAVCSFSACFTSWTLSDLILSRQGVWGQKRPLRLAYKASAMWTGAGLVHPSHNQNFQTEPG